MGSVGNSLDKTLACCAIVKGEYGEHSTTPFSVEIVRLPYDIEKSIRLARDSGMPETKAYEYELRTARYRGLPPPRSDA